MATIEVLQGLLKRVEDVDKADIRPLELEISNVLLDRHWKWLPPSDFLRIGLHDIAREEHEVCRWLRSEGQDEEAHQMEMSCSDLMPKLGKPPAVLSSMDAAAFLIKAVLPDCFWEVDKAGSAWVRINDADMGEAWSLSTPARAMVAALLRAKIALAETAATPEPL